MKSGELATHGRRDVVEVMRRNSRSLGRRFFWSPEESTDRAISFEWPMAGSEQRMSRESIEYQKALIRRHRSWLSNFENSCESAKARLSAKKSTKPVREILSKIAAVIPVAVVSTEGKDETDFEREVANRFASSLVVTPKYRCKFTDNTGMQCGSEQEWGGRYCENHAALDSANQLAEDRRLTEAEAAFRALHCSAMVDGVRCTEKHTFSSLYCEKHLPSRLGGLVRGIHI